jgi:ketosteroid isomerase-like protein
MQPYLLGAAVAVIVGACAPAPRAAAARPEPLYDEILRMDDSLTAAFNGHDAGALMALFAPDIEFYHDKDGLQRYDAVNAGFRSLFAQHNDMRRERVGTLEVFPVPGWGAIEIGAHRFCHAENGTRICGTFQFVQLWRQGAGKWRLARVVSYGHG